MVDCIVQSVAAFGLLMANITCAESPSMMMFFKLLFAPSSMAIRAVDASLILGFVLCMNSVHAKTGIP